MAYVSIKVLYHAATCLAQHAKTIALFHEQPHFVLVLQLDLDSPRQPLYPCSLQQVAHQFGERRHLSSVDIDAFHYHKPASGPRFVSILLHRMNQW
jgi:hypothetical protein